MQTDIYSAFNFGADEFVGKAMTYANPHLLWSVDELKDHVQDPNLVLLDMRPPEAYSNEHIPSARSFDIFGISLIDTRPEPLEAFLWMMEHLIQGKGVNSDSNVVVYDDIAGMRSARLFWFLEFFGHDAVHILNGGFNAWRDAGFPITQQAMVPKGTKLDMKDLKQQAAMPLASFLRFDPWTDQVIQMHTSFEPILSARDKMPFEVTPVYMKLSYYKQPSAAPASAPGAAPAAATTPADAPPVDTTPAPANGTATPAAGPPQQ